MHADAGKCGKLRLESNPIQSENESENEKESEEEFESNKNGGGMKRGFLNKNKKRLHNCKRQNEAGKPLLFFAEKERIKTEGLMLKQAKREKTPKTNGILGV